jgi:hypothetical protein
MMIVSSDSRPRGDLLSVTPLSFFLCRLTPDACVLRAAHSIYFHAAHHSLTHSHPLSPTHYDVAHHTITTPGESNPTQLQQVTLSE